MNNIVNYLNVGINNIVNYVNIKRFFLPVFSSGLGSGDALQATRMRAKRMRIAKFFILDNFVQTM